MWNINLAFIYISKKLTNNRIFMLFLFYLFFDLSRDMVTLTKTGLGLMKDPLPHIKLSRPMHSRKLY